MPSRTEPAAIEITVTPCQPHSRGRFVARLGDRVLVKSTRQPLLDAARILLAEGADPAARIVMRHVGADHAALASTVGQAAKLTVVERDHGNRPVLEPWKARPSFAGASPSGFYSGVATV